MFQDFFQNAIINRHTNKTYICLIPKKSRVMKMGEFRPISLITSFHKIISKVLVDRLKKVLPSIIHNAQSAFIEDRQILDAILITSEAVGEWAAFKEACFIIKLDYEKAYDKVNWAYLDAILGKKKVLGKRKWIQRCLSSANFSIMINGRLRGKFMAKRGLRRRDPLFLFLFTLVRDSFSRLVHFCCQRKYIRGFSVGQNKVEISHLQYADDTIIFYPNDDIMLENWWAVVKIFLLASGLYLILTKTSFIGINMEEKVLMAKAYAMGCRMEKLPFSNLGIPLGGNFRIKSFWDPMLDKVRKNIEKWNNLILSKGARLTLAQSVINSLPLYYFSILKVPMGVIKEMKKLVRNFFWNGDNSKGPSSSIWEIGHWGFP